MNGPPLESSAQAPRASWLRRRWPLLGALLLLGFFMVPMVRTLVLSKRPLAPPADEAPERSAASPKGESPPRPAEGANPPERSPKTEEPLTYAWAPKTTYRFQYLKSIRVAATAEDGTSFPVRISEFSGVLVLDVEAVERDGSAWATMRFDLSKAQLPAARLLDASIPAQDERSAHMARAMEESFKVARWRVGLFPNGQVKVTGRTPPDWNEGLKKLEQAGKWRKKSIAPLYALLEKDLPFDAGSLDADLLVALGAPPEPQGPAGQWGDLHPRRETGPPKRLEHGKVELALFRARSSAAEPQAPVEVPALDAAIPPVRILSGKVESLGGRAVFDAPLKMLDELVEKYRVSVRLACGSQELLQTVEVSTRLNRLAPPLRDPLAQEQESAAP